MSEENQDFIGNSDLDSVAKTIEFSSEYGLMAEVFWSALKAMKDSKGEMSIEDALQEGLGEWDI